MDSQESAESQEKDDDDEYVPPGGKKKKSPPKKIKAEVKKGICIFTNMISRKISQTEVIDF